LTGEIAPLTMGHEFAGVIEEVGENVHEYKIGDRVVINPTLTYGNKHEDLDRYDGFNFIGLHGNGGFADYANVPASNLHRLPDNLTLQDGALVEPTAVAVQAVKDAGVDRKSTRLNSSHVSISYAVFCLKKKKTDHRENCAEN